MTNEPCRVNPLYQGPANCRHMTVGCTVPSHKPEGAADGCLPTDPPAPVAQLDWSLYVDCPKCKEPNDIAGPDHDSEHSISRAIFTNAWDKLAGWEVTCEHCGHDFTIKGVEY